MTRLERGIVRWASLMLLASIAVVAAFSAAATPAWAKGPLTVTNTNDSGAGSLRQAITDANNAPGQDTITFAPVVENPKLDGAIGLRSELPELSSVQIEGPGAQRLTVRPYNDVGGKEDFHGQFRIFTVAAGATVSIDGLTISEGGMTGIDGGAILNPATGTLKITNSTISDNRVDEGSGGGIFNEGTLTVEDSTVCNNSSSGGAIDGGGGIYNAGGGTSTLINSTVCDNTADPVGGAILNRGTLAVTNGTFSNNGAAAEGAGIHNRGNANIESTTITNNQSKFGGGIFNGGGLVLTNSIVARNNTAGNVDGSFTDGGFNLVGDTMFDPMLGPLQDNGGPTKTHLPLAGSPAIDQGSSQGFPKGISPVDQRGVERSQDDPLTSNATSGDGSDIGAVELKVPRASISDVTLTEGTGSTTDATFTVRLSESEVSARSLGVRYVTRDDEATSPADYSSASGTLNFTSRGEAVSKTVVVPVQGDAMDEPTESFLVDLGGSEAGYIADGSALGTIRDDDDPPALSISDATVTEATSGTVKANFTVSLSAPSGKAVSVEYSTSDGTATVASGDYSETSGTLYFRPGTTSKSVPVPVNSDAESESDETFFLNLSGAENATVADGKGEGTIVDSPPPANGAPTANGESYSTGQDKPLRVAAPGLLANDSDPDGDALTAAEVSDPAHGEVFVRANGSFAYFPDDGYLGADSFTYKAKDGSASSAPATVKITVRDLTAPTVTRVVPAENATGIGPAANISAFFSEEMRSGSINTKTIKLFKAGTTTALPATVTYDAATKKATLNPDANLQRGAKYKAVVTGGARDLAGNPLDQNPSVSGNQQKVWFFTIKP